MSTDDSSGFCFEAIGFVENEFKETQRDPDVFVGTVSRIRLLGAFARGLFRIEGYKRLYIIYAFDRSTGFEIVLHPRADPGRPERGVFATHSPRRPNPIGLTVVDLLGVDGQTLTVRGLDAIDGTPVLDIKPCED
ncbi:MAG TPA: tRNA (N6-threonylcarbamoyladenosine(37)-N6)-methyltransferase TrmO [Candidatus Anoxymicrobiaceae bacterium]